MNTTGAKTARTGKPQNIAQIAEQLGVTAGAVSLALRGSSTVSAELRQRVTQVVEESGFKARSYTSRQARKVADPEEFHGRIAILYREDPCDPVTNTIMKSVARRLTELKVPFGMFRRDDVVANPSLVKDFNGFLYDYAWKPDDNHLIEGVPQVAIMNEEVDLGAFDSCKADDREAGKIAAGYLIGRGFRRCIAVWDTKVAHLADRNPRLEGFRWEMRDHGAEFVEIEYDKKEKLPLLTQMLKTQFEAFPGESIGIFAFCDLVASHVCTALDFLGKLREPGKLEVISCDNTYLAQQIQPPIPVVDLHIQEIAERAVDALFWRLAHPGASYTNILLKPNLVLPESIQK